MNLGHGTLENWLAKPPKKELKRGGDAFPYFSKYDSFKSYLNSTLHQEVTKAAILEEVKTKSELNKMIWLNDHGPKHIQTVIQRASEMLTSNCNLNVREVFLLLMAIQVHDIGNFYGRNNHEKRILDLIGTGFDPVVLDRFEVIYVTNIAQVHGGKIVYKDGSENKDTISSVKQSVTTNGYDVRLQLLASILRFADELADDKERADVYSLQKKLLPMGSEIYHAYAFCLDSVRVKPLDKKVELHFKVSKDFLQQKFGKYIQSSDEIIERYIIDEIFDRTLKMHYEKVYCAKFWKNEIEIDEIWVRIEFYNNIKEDDSSGEDYLREVHPDITYTLKDLDYPTTTSITIYTLCPNLKYENGILISGDSITQKIL